MHLAGVHDGPSINPKNKNTWSHEGKKQMKDHTNTNSKDYAHMRRRRQNESQYLVLREEKANRKTTWTLTQRVVLTGDCAMSYIGYSMVWGGRAAVAYSFSLWCLGCYRWLSPP